MTIRLFSIFDPSNNDNIFFRNWLYLYISIILFKPKIYVNITLRIMDFLKKINTNFKFFTYFNIFFLIFMLNLLGLIPYVIALSRHIRISFSLSLSLWLGIIIYSLYNYFNNTLSHLVPYGCPSSLIIFIVVIETISRLIRPITLAVRLSANIIAGHVILALISSISIIDYKNFFVRIIFQRILLILETAVAVVQPYVFITLLILYLKEVR